MTLPKPPGKKQTASNPSMYDRNRQDEAEQERGEALTLRAAPPEASGRLSVAPITQFGLDGLEDIFMTLRRQRRSLKRYEVVQALLDEFLENPEVQAAVVQRLT
ncbi:hypothetical protein Q0M94_21180 (plasmid) [Deinococcus radiomollis]|uniref:hypothetical protein n=1 Tax=Deinococcus radiomollis TaxID=468916 RepID=UPI003891E6B3